MLVVVRYEELVINLQYSVRTLSIDLGERVYALEAAFNRRATTPIYACAIEC